MSLKSVDLSFAVHKNSDAGMLQRELQNKPVADQALLAQTTLKTDELSRQRTAKLDQSDKSRIRDNHKGKNNSSSGHEGERTTSSPEELTCTHKQADHCHPYKGHHIDLSL
jgi:hypothetical protein